MTLTPSLFERFEAYIARLIEAKGIFPSPLMRHDAAGRVTIESLLLDPAPTLLRIRRVIQAERPAGLVFGTDRFTKPGQGTELADALVGAELRADGWHVFVIEYRHVPRLVKPACWDNPFWTQAVRSELAAYRLLDARGGAV